MVGFPWENRKEALEHLAQARHVLEKYLGKRRGCVELNDFELERMSAMAKFPEAYGIDPRGIREWPWASVLEFDKVSE